MKYIVFVCTANRCRSPIAEGILKKKLKENNIDSILVESCGIYDFSGYPPSEKAIEICKKNSIDISGIVSSVLNEKFVKDTDLFLCMEMKHKRFILNEYPELKNKVYTLKEFLRNKKEIYDTCIEDPIGRSQEDFEHTFYEIESEIDRIYPHLIEDEK